MDNSGDDKISFDNNGYCNYCTKALSQIGDIYFPDDEGKRRLDKLIAEVKETGKGRKYDCIMGLSGGLDSSYLAYLGYKWGLRVLAVHIDDGFDTDISKKNLERLIAATKFDYEVIIPDSSQYNALIKAYMKAGVPNLAIPQDNVLLAHIYSCMQKNRIKYFLSGGNFALESILQQGNTYKSSDVVNIRAINSIYGTQSIGGLKFISTLRKLWISYVLHIKAPRPLNYIDYNRETALRELKDFCGFEYYGGKHLENILTAFIQQYWFYKKFGVDKRTSHLSSMIVSGQITRDEALRELSEPVYKEEQMSDYIKIIKEKLGISDEEFAEIMDAPNRQHTDFEVEDDTILFRILKRVLKARSKLGGNAFPKK